MIDIKASAPGKVIVAGEYAVLDGAAAICMAVNRRAHVSITSSSENHHTVSAPGFSDGESKYASISESAEDFPLLAAVWQELQIETPEFLNIVLDSSGFSDATAGKIGIGSSAAVAVALTAALDRLAGEGRDIRGIAMAAHRRLQGGVGSGVDIACSMAGGVIEYRMGETLSAKLQWPAGLNYVLLWSGVAADTRKQIDKLDNAKAQGSRTELGDSASAVAQAWKSGDPTLLMGSLRQYTTTLRRFDVDHKLGIFDAGHAVLADTADASELVYKPCGAGAGDLGIAIASDQAVLAAFAETASEQGFKLMDLAIDTGVVVVDGNQQ